MLVLFRFSSKAFPGSGSDGPALPTCRRSVRPTTSSPAGPSGPPCASRRGRFFFSSRRRHTRYWRDWSSDVCSSDLGHGPGESVFRPEDRRGRHETGGGLRPRGRPDDHEHQIGPQDRAARPRLRPRAGGRAGRNDRPVLRGRPDRPVPDGGPRDGERARGPRRGAALGPVPKRTRGAAAPAAVLLWSAAALAGAPPALAHGFGQRYDLPVPLWLYLYGSAGAVLLSFAVFALFVGGRGAGRGYPRMNLLRFGLFRATLASRAFVSGLQVFSVALFGLVILAGLLGNQTPTLNLAPTMVWVIFWVGFSLFVALVGNLWALVNPLKILFEWADGLARRLGVEEGLEGDAPYPASWGVWPALALFFVFVWVELVFPGSATPRNVAFLMLLYSSVTWAGMSLFGKETWLRNGETFSVFFGILARFAPDRKR